MKMNEEQWEEAIDAMCTSFRRAVHYIREKHGDCEISIWNEFDEIWDTEYLVRQFNDTGEITISIRRPTRAEQT